MKLSGRITVFGEYLLHDNLSACLVLMSKSFLANERKYSEWIHPTYSSKLDRSLRELNKEGLNPKNPIYGNLPLGAGLSSSTALTSLHLNSLNEQKLIKRIDKKICGFSPSNLDYISIRNQECGLYNGERWETLTQLNIEYSIFVIKKERKMSLVEIQKRIKKTQIIQVKTSACLVSEVKIYGKINLDKYKEYCDALLECNVYSDRARAIIIEQKKNGISGKCIGGLYDKGIIFLHSCRNMKNAFDKNMILNYKDVKFIE